MLVRRLYPLVRNEQNNGSNRSPRRPPVRCPSCGALPASRPLPQLYISNTFCFCEWSLRRLHTMVVSGHSPISDPFLTRAHR
jgi:hypothetical protein